MLRAFKYWPMITFLTIIAFKILDVNFNPVVNKNRKSYC